MTRLHVVKLLPEMLDPFLLSMRATYYFPATKFGRSISFGPITVTAISKR